MAVVATLAIGIASWYADFSILNDGRFGQISFPTDTNIQWGDYYGWGVRDMASGGEVLGHFRSAHSSLVTPTRVLVTSTNGPNGMEVVHDFTKSTTFSNLIEVKVTIKNNGPSTLNEIRYRRYDEIDVWGGTDLVRIRRATNAPDLLYLHHEFGPKPGIGLCAGADPISTSCNTAPSNVYDLLSDMGPTLTIQINNLEPGESYYFTMYYGGAPNSNVADTVFTQLDPQLIYLQADTNGFNTDTFMLAYVSGGVIPPDVPPPPPEAPLPPVDCSVCSPSALCEADSENNAVCTCTNGDMDLHGDGSACIDCSVCSPAAFCDGNSNDENAVCTCANGYKDLHGDGSVCDDIDECKDETYTTQCDRLAYCENQPGSWACVCPQGFFGDGSLCLNDAFGVRLVATVPGVASFDESQLADLKKHYATIVTSMHKSANDTIVETMPVLGGEFTLGSRLLGVAVGPNDGDVITLFALFETSEEAAYALSALDSPNWGQMGVTNVADGPAVYRWIGGSTSDELEIPPTGLAVDSVFFDPSCLDSGCWKVDVTYTKGSDDFNAFFLPRASSDDTLSYDPIYSVVDSTWQISQADTFFPANHPCTSMDYDPSSGDLPAAVTACCIPEFLAMYRPVAAFDSAVSATGANLASSVCGTGDRARPVTRSTVPWFTKSGQAVTGSNSFVPPQSTSVVDNVFVDGLFSGMSFSNIYHTSVVDAYIGVYTARLELDEVEVRSLAGQRKGTVGVEHSVNTFVGLVNFSPTGSKVLDTGAVQVNIHLEKTSFFSVSTHGTNDYTFLEYVNLRLVSVFEQDNDFSGTSESTERTVETSGANAADFLQVTFTLGSQYEVNTNTGLVPLDSVRAGSGTFFNNAAIDHKCLEWTGNSFAQQGTFQGRLQQDCAPAAGMCASPSSIPDSFVSFNVPLGIAFLPPPSSTLSQNVFVDMVISAVDTTAPKTSSNGDNPMQMKTTLTASIPVVEGGVNIFCDGYTAKTDLRDVADVDIVVGSASSAAELTRLRVKEDIASTQLQEETITSIDSDSIEAGLMTLVLKGDASYFQTNSGRRQVTMELEDVITIHIMESDGSGESTSVATSVMALITTAPDDNSNTNGLDTDGYKLNGAFSLAIDRSAQRAHLEPVEDLLTICPYSPQRPANTMSLETCVSRRDVRYRGYPSRPGTYATAMEICTHANGAGTDITAGTCPSASGTSSSESAFFTTILGDSTYSKTLAVAYAGVISDHYKLNGRYVRAYWINPGYEWTPTQTGGVPVFSVSQKLFMFALVTLDEGLATGDAGEVGATLNLPLVSRRRMLLQSTPDQALQDGQSSLNAEALEFQTSPFSMMAKAFEVPEDRVATFKVTLQLTSAEACMLPTELQASIRGTLDEYLSGAASTFHTVQVTAMAVDKAGVQCSRRSLRGLLSSFSEASAEVTMMVVFQAGTSSTISLAKLQTMPGINAAEPLSVSPKVNTAAGPSYVPPPSPSEGGGQNVGLLAGAVAGGVVVLLALAAGVVYAVRSKERQGREVASVVQSVNIEDLKHELQGDV